METTSELLKQLQAIVGEKRLLTDELSFQHYGVDRTTLWQPHPLAVVLPETVEQVQQLVLLANRERISLVPSGGRTGLSGGAVAEKGELVVALDKMNQVLDFNAIERTVTCQAGIITQQLQAFAEEQGLYYPVDFASSGSSQIGGNIATNAGGIKVIHYGMTRDWVLGLKVVTGTGEILDLNRGLVKNNSGYDFRHLFIGSEGTLGIICEATLKLARPAQDLAVMVLGVTDFPVIMDVLKTFTRSTDLYAFEFFSHQALEKVLAHTSNTAPFESPATFYALLEFEQGGEADQDRIMALFEHCVEQGWVVDGVISQSQTQAQNLWRLREDISETLSQWKPYKNDISVSISNMPSFIEAVNQLVATNYAEFEVIWFGHIGDGNIHLNILKPEDLPVDEFAVRCGEVSGQVAALVRDHDGSISAEHGIGLLKKDYLSYTRSAAEIELMKQVKQVFDPNNIMNPGKLFD